ncbi:M13-type metalloendopeptidase [Arthrobacter sp. H5]|uniref:M13 family metallopeptidase n=1 Tax=Arthrobacter sp. H5 TaxID=1267973 RepID=UPI0004825A2B|nr:M13-type metalloendopeptidase [Arthrobacter sp. H5]
MENTGIDPTHFDHATRPQDDLFRHVNGGWLAATSIPEDRALEGSFTQLRDEAELAVRGIVEEAAGSLDGNGDRRRIGALYASFMDTQRIEDDGVKPLRPLLERINAVASVQELVLLDAGLSRTGVPGLALPYVTNDAGTPDRYLVHLYQSGLGMPDESYYREDKFADAREAYTALLERLLALVDIPEARTRAAAVFDLETRLACSHMDAVTRRDPQATYNLHTAESLAGVAAFTSPWLAALTQGTSDIAEIVASQPEYLAGVSNALEDTSLEDWKSWLTTRVLLHAANYLGDDFVNASFSFYGTFLTGTPAIKERWKRGIAVVEGAVGDAVGREYVARHFPESHKEKMQALVTNLLTAYEESIRFLEWMTAETKERALEKLSLFTTKIGYPETWIDYSPLTIKPDDLYGNVGRATAFELDRQLAKLGGPIDRGEWHMTPQTVNAYYMPTMNEIVFPAAILQPPFFDADADPAANYGAIGAVIGHEIGHGFDDQGSQFDGRGELHNWWTDADREAFRALTNRLVDQYNKLEPLEAPGHSVNGKLTLGENIGDLGGLSISFRAYTISLNGTEPPVINGIGGTQRYFYSWAECWRQKIRSEEAARRIAVDPHSPNEFRCNQVVRNLGEFHRAFAVTETDSLWLDAAERVRIW